MSNVYISGALTNVPDSENVKSFYEAIGKLCEEVGLSPYIPHKHTDPKANSDVTPQTVFSINKERVISSDLLIAYVGIQSLGVGMELGFAYTFQIPVILLYQATHRVSRMVRGIPATTKYAEIVFDDYQDALGKLEIVLTNWMNETKKGTDQGVTRLHIPSKMMFRLKAEAGEYNFEIDLIDESNTPSVLERRLTDLKEKGVKPSKLYIDIWLYSQTKEIISKVWPDVPILMEYEV